MTPVEAKLIIRNRFSELNNVEDDGKDDDAWWHQEDCETYLGLFDLMVLVMSAEDALNVLGQAYSAAANEFGS